MCVASNATCAVSGPSGGRVLFDTPLRRTYDPPDDDAPRALGREARFVPIGGDDGRAPRPIERIRQPR